MQSPLAPVLLSLTLLVLWIAVLVQDLRRRQVALVVLAGLALLSLLGRRWPWWLLTGAVLLWPLRRRRQMLVLAPAAAAVGCVSGELAPAAATAVAALAWSLSWWGGADGIALVALGLRYDAAGLLAGAAAAALGGLAVHAGRRTSWWAVPAAALRLRDLQPAGDEIPPEREFPGAAALAVAGIVLEACSLLQVIRP